MKLFHIRSRVYLGPGTPYEGIVREEDEQKAIECFVDANKSVFTATKPTHALWFSERLPKNEDFVCKQLAADDDRWPDHFDAKLRDPEFNKGPLLSDNETITRNFLEDRIVLRVFRAGGIRARIAFAFQLWVIRKLREFAGGLEKSVEKDDYEDEPVALLEAA